MLQTVTNNRLLFIIIHIVIGFLATFSFFPKLFVIAILITGFAIIILSNNEREEALFISAYMVGVEVFLRMIKSGISYELGKYSVIIFLITGMLVGITKQRLTASYLVYLLLLSLGIVFTQVPEGESIRRAIIFNLSGSVVLAVSALYLYKRPIRKSELYELLFFILLPLFSMVTFLYFRTPDLKTIAFGGGSLGETSGGFGPNQVATALGIGIFILGTFLFLRIKISGYFILDAAFLAYFTYRGLLTFSRGGIITAGAAFVFFAIFMFIYQRGTIASIFKYLVIIGIFILGVWLYTSDVTGGMLNNRYTGRNAIGEKKRDITSGRGKIFKTQLEGFYDAPVFGIGVGNGKYKRQLSGENVTAASHNEVSRLLEEHGFIGLIMLVMLLTIPLGHFYNSNNYQRAFLISFYIFWFLTINHSAMRIAFPGFIYGLSLLKIVEGEE